MTSTTSKKKTPFAGNKFDSAADTADKMVEESTRRNFSIDDLTEDMVWSRHSHGRVVLVDRSTNSVIVKNSAGK